MGASWAFRRRFGDLLHDPAPDFFDLETATLRISATDVDLGTTLNLSQKIGETDDWNVLARLIQKCRQKRRASARPSLSASAA